MVKHCNWEKKERTFQKTRRRSPSCWISNDKAQVATLASNVNTIAEMLKLGRIPEDGTIDEEVAAAFQYFIDNRDLFIEHGITEHINAKKLEQMTASVYTEAEAANIPTIDDMKKLEVDIGKLYTDEGTSQV